ncbi:MAG: hypothetical protein ACREGF_00735 [Candidatus Saccharimonadales bacterium]
MDVLVIYKPMSERARLAEEFMHDFKRLHSDINLQTIDADSVEGVQKLELNGLYQTPAILVTRQDGQVIKSWAGDVLPLMSEVVGYVTS